MTQEFHSESFYYVIPSSVFNDNRISPKQLKLYALISGLARSCGYCYATNAYLAKRLDCDERNIGLNLNKLEKLGHIRRTLEFETHRKIFIGVDKISHPPGQNCPPPLDKNSHHSIRSKVIEIKKAAAGAAVKKVAAAPSIETQIKKSRIPKDQQEAALQFFRDNPKKFKNAQNPIGLLVKIVDEGDHIKNIKDTKITALRKKWGASHEWTGPSGSHCCTKMGFVITNGRECIIHYWDSDDDFWKTKGL